MKTISKIKSAVDKKSIPKSKIVKTVVKTPSNLRAKDKRDDEVLQMQKLLKLRSVALEGTIKKKTKKLDVLNEKIIKKVESYISAGANIIKESEKRAKFILSEAKSSKVKSDNVLSGAKQLKIKLEGKEKELEKLAGEVKQSQIVVRKKNIEVDKVKLATYDKLEVSADKLHKVEELYSSVGALHLAAVDIVASLLDIYAEAYDRVSQNQEKTDKIYIEVKKLEKMVEADKVYNTKRTKDLDTKEIWIKDRYKSLERSAKEIKKKIKHGK